MSLEKIVIVAALAIVGCARPSATDEAGPSREALDERGEEEPNAPSPGGELLLDARSDGARITASLVPPPPNADPDRVLIARADLGGRPLAPELEGARVLDARFAGERFVVLGTDHVLRAMTLGGQTIELDDQVEGPLSVAGDRVAYVRGDWPDLELAAADLASGRAETLTQGMAPAWSPALSPDGREIVFASSLEGRPRLYRRGPDGSIHPLPSSARFPTAPSAPRWIGSTLIVEDARGVATIDLESGTLISEAPGARQLVVVNGAPLARIDGALRPVGGAR